MLFQLGWRAGPSGQAHFAIPSCKCVSAPAMVVVGSAAGVVGEMVAT